MESENVTARFEEENAAVGYTDAYKRLGSLFDGGSFTEIGRFAKNKDKLCGVVTAYGNIGGTGAYAFSQDVSVAGGAMSSAQAAKIKKIYDLAFMNGAPVIGIFDSKGAFAEEGVDALNAYGDLIAAAGKLSGVVPQISVIAGTCVGSAAVLAGLADIVIMVKDASFCVNSPFITGSDKTGTAESALKSGTAALVAETADEAMEFCAKILSYLPENNLSVPFAADYVPAEAGGDGVYSAISSFADAGSFTEICSEFGKCVKTGFARLGGNPVGIVATDPDKNGAKICAGGASKAARFVRLCDAFSVPLVTVLDSAGFMGSAEEELDGSLKSVASLTAAYSEATTAKVTLITGKAYGAAYTCFAGKAASADYVIALENSVISALEPMTAVQFLYSDRLADTPRDVLIKEYAANEGSPFKAAEKGAVDDVIKAEDTAEKIIAALDMLASKRVSTVDKKHSVMPL